MKFWDSSAILPLMVEESSTVRMQEILTEDPVMAVWWGTETECFSALARREREGGLRSKEAAEAEVILRWLLASAHEVSPSQEVRRTARRLLMSHALRAADSLQLAAALLLAGDEVRDLPFVTLDERLMACARREGCPVMPE